MKKNNLNKAYELRDNLLKKTYFIGGLKKYKLWKIKKG